ncbi:hypothetical protein F5148DRAFT_41263 [Russula earlei]|uniref:Uncharacterized protein n=1 Tax=Russula earlei TaxID=71964 RepID=A0ACC0U9S7_9AGAM|nr:hypothetical protein F5148DRAFT_41263 [Russula earlei]
MILFKLAPRWILSWILYSALVSVTVPGHCPSPQRFPEHLCSTQGGAYTQSWGVTFGKGRCTACGLICLPFPSPLLEVGGPHQQPCRWEIEKCQIVVSEPETGTYCR